MPSKLFKCVVWKSPLFVLAFLLLLSAIPVRADEFFQLRKLILLDKPNEDNIGVWISRVNPSTNKEETVFTPSVAAFVKTQKRYRSDDTYAKIYYFDSDQHLLATVDSPIAGRRPTKSDYAIPEFFSSKDEEVLFFPIPEQCRDKKWTALCVFGDKDGASTKTCPDRSSLHLDYPEKPLVEMRFSPPERKEAIDTITEYVANDERRTGQQITLFLTLPPDVSDIKEIKGVLAICMLAGNVDYIRRILQRWKPNGDEKIYKTFESISKTFPKQNPEQIANWLSRLKTREPGVDLQVFDEMMAMLLRLKGPDQTAAVQKAKTDLMQLAQWFQMYTLFRFAEENHLAVLTWGSQGSGQLWDPRMNNDDMNRKERGRLEKSFKLTANLWDRGVKQLLAKRGLEPTKFLLWGFSGSAQFAHRLALEKPERFLAVHIHLAGSYGHPTLEGASVLWCVTTGERDGGYAASKDFVAKCRALGYPIIYKAIPGLGHSWHPDTTALGIEFFKFSLTQSASEGGLAGAHSNSSMSFGQGKTWCSAFQNPAYFGDIVNQEMYPPSQSSVIPGDFKVPLPTAQIANIWIRWNDPNDTYKD